MSDDSSPTGRPAAPPRSAPWQALLDAGRWAEAAEAALLAGELVEAERLFVRLWDWPRAAAAAAARGDVAAQVSHLLDGGYLDEALLLVAGQLQAESPARLEALGEAMVRHRRWSEAAQLARRRGRLDLAVDHLTRGGLWLEAARLERERGRFTEAGQLLERQVDLTSGAEQREALVELARLHQRLGGHAQATRLLQRALQLETRAPHAPIRCTEACGALADSLEALGLTHAAAHWRRHAAEGPDGVGGASARTPVTGTPADGTSPATSSAALPNAGSDEAALPDTIPRLGERYGLLRLLGSGGMGRVYLARDLLTGREVAVKLMLRPSDGERHPGWSRFVEEARTMALLVHPHIVETLEVDSPRGLLVMEYLPGGTLADRLGSPLPLSFVRRIVRGLVSALAAAHSHGVVHRDLKPDNILLTSVGEAKLADFGVAHLQDLEATQTAGFVGTLAYLAPEQLSGGTPTAATDVYALGVTLFQLLTGRLPFLGPDFVSQHLGEAIPSPALLRPGLPEAWSRLLLSLLEKSPLERPVDLGELQQELERLPVDEPPRTALFRGEAEVSLQEPSDASPALDPPAAPPRSLPLATLEEGPHRRVELRLDRRLGREELVERLTAIWAASVDGKSYLDWLGACARLETASVQRIFALTHLGEDGVEVRFERLAGTSVAPEALTHTEVERLLHLLAPLHRAGRVHGALAQSLYRVRGRVVLSLVGGAPRDPRCSVEDEQHLLAQWSAAAPR